MSDPFVDTNIVLWHLLQDDPVQSPACTSLIRAIERGETKAWTTEVMIAEVVYVLSSKTAYALDRGTIRDLLVPIVAMARLDLPSKHLYPRILDLFTTLRIDFADAYHAALIERRAPPELYSYDLHFDRVPTLQRIEP